MTTFWRQFVLVFAVVCFAGCQKNTSPTQNAVQKTARNNTTPNFDPWILATNKVDVSRGNSGIFLGNGFLGAGFGANGGADATTKCFAAGAYNDEHLARLPVWNRLDLPAKTKIYAQSLDLKNGVLTTRFGSVKVTSFVSLPRRNLAVLHIEGAPRPKQLPSIEIPSDWIAVEVNAVSVHEKTWKMRTTDGKTTLQMRVHEVVDSPRSWTRFVQIEIGNRVLDSPPDYRNALNEHEIAWQKRWRADVKIESDREAQQLIHALMFNLLCCVRNGASDSIAPEALAGDHYRGHIFWDAEMWMFPALVAQHPELAKTVLDYRFKHLNQARQIAKNAGFAGADFPWESASSGREVAPAEFAKERHITADVGWAHWQYWLWTRDKTWLKNRGWPVISGVADYWTSRAKFNLRTKKYDILRVLGPDENGGIVDNNSFTNAMAKNCLQNAIAASRVLEIRSNPQWNEVARQLDLPFDAKRGVYLKNRDDNGQKTKQADGELMIYPADLSMSRAVAQRTFDFHKTRSIRFGPAMTTSVYTVIAARLGLQSEAEIFFDESYKPFVRGPFLLFSEKRSLDRCVFATGIGGVLQSVLYGFGDLRAQDFGQKFNRRSTLPKSWKSLTISGIKHNGGNYTLKVTPNSRRLMQTNEPVADTSGSFRVLDS